MLTKSCPEMKEAEKALALGVYADWSDQSQRYFSELLSRYPKKEMTLQEARALLSSRLKNRSLSDIVRENRET